MDNRFREVNRLVVKHTKWSLFQKKNREERERERERDGIGMDEREKERRRMPLIEWKIKQCIFLGAMHQILEAAKSRLSKTKTVIINLVLT